MPKRSAFLVSLLAISFVASGCIFSPDKKDGSEPPQPIPDNDTPENAMLRFRLLYEQKKTVDYEKMFTGNFTFEFSNSSDPDLVQKFSTGWFREDEKVAARNLFQGGTNSDGDFQPAASRIELQLAQKVPSDDNAEGRDPVTHKVLLTPITLEIEVPPRPGQSQSTTFVVGGGLDPALHRFFLVRGDVASGLSADQPATDRKWYIWRWIDETTTTTAPGVVQASTSPTPSSEEATSWGRLKARAR